MSIFTVTHVEWREEEESLGGGVKGGYIPVRDKPDARRRPSGKHQTHPIKQVNNLANNTH